MGSKTKESINLTKNQEMNTIDKLQDHLTAVVLYKGTWSEYKEQASAIECADGTTLSVQASKDHYSTPRENEGPYTEVEVWLVTAPVTEFEYSSDEPSSYVPIEQVAQFIDNHGGMV